MVLVCVAGEAKQNAVKMGGAPTTRITWWIVVVLVVAGTGSGMPRGLVKTPPPSVGFDLKQYEFAKAMNNVEFLKEPIGDLEERHVEWIGTPVINFKEISQETIDRICLDLDMDIMVDGEDRLVDCRQVRLQLTPVVASGELENFSSDRLKREAIDETEGSGGNSLVQDNITNNAPSTNTSSVQLKEVSDTTQPKVAKETSNQLVPDNINNNASSTNTPSVQLQEVNDTTQPKVAKETSNPVIQGNINNNAPLTNTSSVQLQEVSDATQLKVTKETSELVRSKNLTETVSTEKALTMASESEKGKNVTSVLETTEKITYNAISSPNSSLPAVKETLNAPGNLTNITTIGSKEGQIAGNKTEIHRKGKHMDIGSLNNPQQMLENDKLQEGVQGVHMNDTKQLSENPVADTSTKKSSGKTTIIWFLFGGVVIAGAALIGYRYMKKRRIQQATPVAARNAAKPQNQQSSPPVKEQEMRPLMTDVDRGNNIKTNTADMTDTSQSQGDTEARIGENGTGDHLSKVETINETKGKDETKLDTQETEE